MNTRAYVFFLIFLIWGNFTLFSQQESDSIHIVENPKLNFFHNGERLKHSEVILLLKKNNNTQSLNLFTYAQTNYNLGYALETAGALAMGYTIFRLLVYKDPMNWGLCGAGFAAYLISYPLIKGYKKKSKRAISLYNSSLASSAFKREEWQIGVSSSGVGLTLLF